MWSIPVGQGKEINQWSNPDGKGETMVAYVSLCYTMMKLHYDETTFFYYTLLHYDETTPQGHMLNLKAVYVLITKTEVEFKSGRYMLWGERDCHSVVIEHTNTTPMENTTEHGLLKLRNTRSKLWRCGALWVADYTRNPL